MNWKNDPLKPILFRRRAEWSGVAVNHVRVLAGEMLKHELPCHEISITLAGSIHKRHFKFSRSRKMPDSPGDMCILPAGNYAAALWKGEIENLGIDLDTDFVRRTALENHFSANFEIIDTIQTPDALIRQIGLTLLDEADTVTPAGKLYADSLTQTLIFHLLKNYSTAKIAETVGGGLSGYKLRRVQEFIRANLEKDLSLAEIAEIADLSQFHFARAFRKTTGQTTQQFLMQQRIELAKELLAKNDLPIIEISFQTGFKNQSHFTTLFRKFTKFTPKMWRELKLA